MGFEANSDMEFAYLKSPNYNVNDLGQRNFAPTNSNTMFFNLSSSKISSYPISYELPCGFFLNCDLGWKKVDQGGRQFFFKGYWEDSLSEEVFLNKLALDPRPHLKGNFLAFISNSRGQTFLTFSKNRSTPIFYKKDQSVVTNFPNPSFDSLGYDQFLSINLSQEKIYPETFKPFGDLNKPPTPKSREEVVDGLIKILSIKIQRLKELSIYTPVKIFLSGGLDTLTLLALLRSHQVQHEFLLYEFFEYDTFTSKNLKTVQSFWAYNQIHHWIQPHYLVSGSNGDESLMRNPRTGVLNLIYRDVPVWELLKGPYKHCYASHYLNREKNIESLRSLTSLQNKIRKYEKDSFYYDILIQNYLDFQHWHLGNTLTFTPYKDIDLVKIMMSADSEFLTEQFFNGQINRDIISKLAPDLLDKISRFKNYNSMENCLGMFRGER